LPSPSCTVLLFGEGRIYYARAKPHCTSTALGKGEAYRWYISKYCDLIKHNEAASLRVNEGDVPAARISRVCRRRMCHC
jgi:hypothetical protein